MIACRYDCEGAAPNVTIYIFDRLMRCETENWIDIHFLPPWFPLNVNKHGFGSDHSVTASTNNTRGLNGTMGPGTHYTIVGGHRGGQVLR